MEKEEDLFFTAPLLREHVLDEVQMRRTLELSKRRDGAIRINGVRGLGSRTWFELDMGFMGLRWLSSELRLYTNVTSLFLDHNR